MHWRTGRRRASRPEQGRRPGTADANVVLPAGGCWGREYGDLCPCDQRVPVHLAKCEEGRCRVMRKGSSARPNSPGRTQFSRLTVVGPHASHGAQHAARTLARTLRTRQNPALDGVPLLVEVGDVTDGPAAVGALLLSVGGLVILLGDDCLHVVFAQVGPVTTRRVGFVPCGCVRAGAGAGGGLRPADAHLAQHGDELRAVRGLSRGQDERQGAALAVGGEVDPAGLPAPGASQESGLQTESAPAPGASSLLALGICFGILPVSFFGAAPFDLAFSSSSAAFSRAVRTSWSRCVPAASW